MAVIFAEQQPIDGSDPGVAAIRLVNKQRGANHITCGVATFEPGAEIPMHTHPCEESVIILEGKATAHVDGEVFQLGKYDTTFVPPLVPHCFKNESDQKMVISYFYPAVDVSRDPVDEGGPGRKRM